MHLPFFADVHWAPENSQSCRHEETGKKLILDRSVTRTFLIKSSPELHCKTELKPLVRNNTVAIISICFHKSVSTQSGTCDCCSSWCSNRLVKYYQMIWTEWPTTVTKYPKFKLPPHDARCCPALSHKEWARFIVSHVGVVHRSCQITQPKHRWLPVPLSYNPSKFCKCTSLKSSSLGVGTKLLNSTVNRTGIWDCYSSDVR